MQVLQYIRLIARPNTWYKAGTEVFWEGDEPGTARRLSVIEWDRIRYPDDGHAALGCVGLRVVENPAAEGGGSIGDERWDGEWCSASEFDVEIVDEPKDAP